MAFIMNCSAFKQKTIHERGKIMTESMKPSMFNIVCENGEELLIYNTYQGTSSILRVSAEKKDIVTQLLKGNFESLDNEKRFILSRLTAYGFFVDAGTDEFVRRDVLYAQNMMSNRLELVIHTTQNCNFRCNYCGINFQNRNLSSDMQKAIVSYVTKNIGKYSGVKISWFGGEPLMDMSVIENISIPLIKLCEKAHKPYSANVTTNGYLLSPENIDILIRCRVSDITVTVDGVMETHNQTRVLLNGEGTFEKIMTNLEYIRDNVSSRILKILIRTNLTKSMTNHEYLKKYYSFYDEKFGSDNRFQLFVRPVRDWGGERVKKMQDNLLEVHGENMADVYSFLSTLIHNIRYDGNMVDLCVAGITCPGKRMNKYTITVDGWVNKCDNSENELSVGELTSNGMLLSTDKCFKWLVNKGDTSKCHTCPLSCLCFMDGCPKARMRENETSCAIDYEEVKGLLKLFAASYRVEYL